MKLAAIGIRMHSGWGALVAVCGDADEVEVIDRRNIVVAVAGIAGAKQPYHHAANLGLPKAELYIENCAAVSERLASAAIREVIGELQTRYYRVAGAAVLLASGRPLPSLAEILASHALIHTAEGEFFRRAVRDACERMGITVSGIRERELAERGKAVFGDAADQVQRKISNLGKSLGPRWTTDQKTSALAAMIVLATT